MASEEKLYGLLSELTPKSRHGTFLVSLMIIQRRCSDRLRAQLDQGRQGEHCSPQGGNDGWLVGCRYHL